MNDSDKKSHPWPLNGFFDFRFRRAVWMRATPWYMASGVNKFTGKDVRYFQIFRFWFPFFTWNIKIKEYGIHGYIGWKPIPVADDPAFGWRDLTEAKKAIEKNELFVQLSVRGGIGAIG